MRPYNPYRPRRSRFGWLKWLLLLLVFAGSVVGVLMFFPQFERTPPTIEAPQSSPWNPNVPIEVVLRDNRGIRSYEAVLTNGTENIPVAANRFAIPPKEIKLTFPLAPKTYARIKNQAWKLLIQAQDTSYWNRLIDNSAVAAINIITDTQPPRIKLLAKSKTIARGGSALVIFRVEDISLKSVYVEAGGQKFYPNPYRHAPYYATLIAWPFRQKHLNATIVATDKAGNKSTEKLAFAVVYKKYKTSWIRATDRFINGRITEVARSDPHAAGIADPIQRFRAVNETMRLDNEKQIHTLARAALDREPIRRWRVHAFYPLKGAKLVADFGDERHYYYRNPKKEISRSYHVGYDLASVRHAPIRASNGGRVLFAGHNGIYGKMPLIDHGFGLVTLYGHCSQLLVSKGDTVAPGEMIARTGKTGLALGDHLHFGVLVHGIEVWPMDWMKENWIKKNINRIFEQADKIIDRAEPKGSAR